MGKKRTHWPIEFDTFSSHIVSEHSFLLKVVENISQSEQLFDITQGPAFIMQNVEDGKGSKLNQKDCHPGVTTSKWQGVL